jgi:hypothetical protein
MLKGSVEQTEFVIRKNGERHLFWGAATVERMSTQGYHPDLQALVQAHSLFAQQYLEDLEIGEG